MGGRGGLVGAACGGGVHGLKLISKTISQCADCPYFRFRKGKPTCFDNVRLKPSRNIQDTETIYNGFPPWCPLPDFTEPPLWDKMARIYCECCGMRLNGMIAEEDIGSWTLCRRCTADDRALKRKYEERALRCYWKGGHE
jgi:hypothetical protein